MKSIHLNSRTNLDWKGKLVDETNYDLLVKDEDTTVYKPDGSILLVLKKRATSLDANVKAWSVLDKINFTSSNRGTASGLKPIKRIRKDGTQGKTTAVPERLAVTSFIIGYFDRNPRFPFCRPAIWNQKNPEEFKKLFPLCQEVSSRFEELVPDKHFAQAEFVNSVHPDFVIPGSVFTTLTVNKNFRTACHKDAGDFAEGFGSIVCIRSGKFSGGELILPDFRVAVSFDTQDVLFFDVHEWHGNTRIRELTPDAKRCTVVLYCREMMNQCGSCEEELERAKNRKLGDSLEDSDTELQSSEGTTYGETST